MKKLLITMAFVMAFMPPAMAQNVSKGDVQRLNLDQITLDSTVVTATGAEINTIADGVTATAAEVNNTADASNRVDQITANTEALTLADDGDRLIFASATGGNQTITLPDGGTATGGRYKIVFGAGAPTGDYAVTVTVPTGDNSIFNGAIAAANETDGIFYNSSADTAGSDTITFTSGNTEAGDWIEIISGTASVFNISGIIRYESNGDDTVLFSSAVDSVD